MHQIPILRIAGSSPVGQATKTPVDYFGGFTFGIFEFLTLLFLLNGAKILIILKKEMIICTATTLPRRRLNIKN